MNQINEDSSADLDFYFPYAMGYMGIVFALVLANLGAAYGTAKSGVGICAMGVMKPSVIVKGVIPVIMAGILGIYGLIVSVILSQNINNKNEKEYKFTDGLNHLGSGMCCGLASLAAGVAIGIGGEAGVRAMGHQDRVFVGMMLILIFSEALGLYGLIVSLIMSQNK
jgi:V-type H+-transporting ATPase proteolipid subunit